MSCAGLAAEGLAEEVRDDAAEREALDALRAPLRADLVAGNTPHFFRIGLEEEQVELLAEAVDDEVFEGLLFAAREQSRAHVAEAALHGAGDAQIAEGGCGEADRVVEEAAEEVDSALALAHQHDPVLGVGIGRLGSLRKVALLAVILELAFAGARLDGEHFEPPLHHAVGF